MSVNMRRIFYVMPAERTWIQLFLITSYLPNYAYEYNRETIS